MNQFSALPLMPFDPSWIEQHPAFCHDDVRLAKAALQLLFAAWRGVPAGTIPASHAYIAQTCALPREVISEHYVTLTDGFLLDDSGRLHHTKLAQVIDALGQRYGKEIEQYSMAMVMAAQDPQEFAMASVDGRAARKPRGKTALPRDFGWKHLAGAGIEEWLASNGYPALNQREWLMTNFIDYTLSRDDKSADWAAQFRLHASITLAQFSQRIPAPELPQDLFDDAGGAASANAPRGPFGRFGRTQSASRGGSAGEDAVNWNLNKMGASARRA
jgi:hypothetical protein